MHAAQITRRAHLAQVISAFLGNTQNNRQKRKGSITEENSQRTELAPTRHPFSVAAVALNRVVVLKHLVLRGRLGSLQSVYRAPNNGLPGGRTPRQPGLRYG